MESETTIPAATCRWHGLEKTFRNVKSNLRVRSS